jgi:hypothetical protein
MANKLAADFLSQYDDTFYPEALSERFETMECLNRNQAGETLLVREKATGRLLAAKCFYRGHPLYEAAEPEALRALSHPGLPAFAEELRSDRIRCVLREYIPGKTLTDKRAEGPFTEAAVSAAGIQLCGILKYLHSQNPPVIHRDIKPQNVIMREDGSLALIDLGISRLFEAGAQADTVLCGTQDFAPPEQYGFLQTDSRSDIYSLGILLAWMLTGRARPVPEPRTALEHAINKCAAFAPEKRYRDAEAAERALRESLPGTGGKRRLLKIAAGLLTAGLLTIGLIWLQSGLSKASPEPSAETVPSLSAPAESADSAAFLSASVTASPAAAIKSAAGFTEPLIEEAVRLMLGKTADEPMTPTEIASVTELYINNDTACADISAFYAAHQEWAAAGAKGRGPVASLEDLKLLPNLRIFCAAAEQIRDLTPLSSLPNLYQVELRVNDVSDISPLSGLYNLSYVGLNSNPVTDISPLAGCPSLQSLDLCGVTGKYDASALTQLGDLRFLDISNGTDSYKYLGGKTIIELKISMTSLDDLSLLRDVKGLGRLEVNNTPLTDLSGLLGHQDLTYLNLCGIPASDYTALLALPLLEEVVASSAARELIDPVAAQGLFTVIYQ